MKEEYDELLHSGMFWVFFPGLTGDWAKDMASWIEFKINHDK